jgi:hypothetical protein
MPSSFASSGSTVGASPVELPDAAEEEDDVVGCSCSSAKLGNSGSAATRQASLSSEAASSDMLPSFSAAARRAAAARLPPAAIMPFALSALPLPLPLVLALLLAPRCDGAGVDDEGFFEEGEPRCDRGVGDEPGEALGDAICVAADARHGGACCDDAYTAHVCQKDAMQKNIEKGKSSCAKYRMTNREGHIVIPALALAHTVLRYCTA